MKELKTYISEGFFTNVDANNIIRPVIDTIKDASINDKVDLVNKKYKFGGSLVTILKNLEANIKKGKIVFEYIKNDSTIKEDFRVTITLIIEPYNIKWMYVSQSLKLGRREAIYISNAKDIAFSIAMDLYHEAAYPAKEAESHHSIAKTIKVTEFKVS